MVLDGSERVDEILKLSMSWDVMVGVSRRSWAGNKNSVNTVKDYNRREQNRGIITEPEIADEKLIESLILGEYHAN